MKGALILLVTAIVVCVGNRLKEFIGIDMPRLDINLREILQVSYKLFSGYGTNFRYIGEVKNGLDRVTVVTSIPIPRYSDIEIRPIVFNNCTENLWRHGARTRA